jgi:hypothetical protein
MILGGLFHIVSKNPVQAASRRAFIFTMLLQRLNFSIGMQDGAGNTLIELAGKGRHTHFVRLLEKKSAAQDGEPSRDNHGINKVYDPSSASSPSRSSARCRNRARVHDLADVHRSTSSSSSSSTSPIKKVKTGDSITTTSSLLAVCSDQQHLPPYNTPLACISCDSNCSVNTMSTRSGGSENYDVDDVSLSPISPISPCTGGPGSCAGGGPGSCIGSTDPSHSPTTTGSALSIQKKLRLVDSP